MYQTLIQQAELRRQDIEAWAAREQLARQATVGQKGVFTQLSERVAMWFARPQPHQPAPINRAAHRAARPVKRRTQSA